MPQLYVCLFVACVSRRTLISVNFAYFLRLLEYHGRFSPLLAIQVSRRGWRRALTALTPPVPSSICIVLALFHAYFVFLFIWCRLSPRVLCQTVRMPPLICISVSRTRLCDYCCSAATLEWNGRFCLASCCYTGFEARVTAGSDRPHPTCSLNYLYCVSPFMGILVFLVSPSLSCPLSGGADLSPRLPYHFTRLCANSNIIVLSPCWFDLHILYLTKSVFNALLPSTLLRSTLSGRLLASSIGSVVAFIIEMCGCRV